MHKGLPWRVIGEESICQCRSLWFERWSGQTPHAMEQQSPYATAIEPVF